MEIAAVLVSASCLSAILVLRIATFLKNRSPEIPIELNEFNKLPNSSITKCLELKNKTYIARNMRFWQDQASVDELIAEVDRNWEESHGRK